MQPEKITAVDASGDRLRRLLVAIIQYRNLDSRLQHRPVAGGQLWHRPPQLRRRTALQTAARLTEAGTWAASSCLAKSPSRRWPSDGDARRRKSECPLSHALALPCLYRLAAFGTAGCQQRQAPALACPSDISPARRPERPKLQPHNSGSRASEGHASRHGAGTPILGTLGNPPVSRAFREASYSRWAATVRRPPAAPVCSHGIPKDCVKQSPRGQPMQVQIACDSAEVRQGRR